MPMGAGVVESLAQALILGGSHIYYEAATCKLQVMQVPARPSIENDDEKYCQQTLARRPSR